MTQASSPSVVAPDADGIGRAAEVLWGGGLVALPTETVYGLAARADRQESVEAIYRAKGRPSFNPLIVHVSDVAQAQRVSVFDERARRLAAAFWPGPLTMVLPARGDAAIAPGVTAGLSTIAVRCPAHPVMRAVLEKAGVPLAAPSANRSGAVSPTCAQHVVASLRERVDLVLDGGPCTAGLESTIVALRPEDRWEVLRPGPISQSEIEDLIGTASCAQAGRIEAPGQLASHYAPGKPVRLNARAAEADEFFIGFGPIAGDVQLSASGDVGEAASRLYALLHEGAASPKPRIAVAPIPEADIGIALNDRLRRAAA
ncbi:L-threonylcarbamoyladenylate synthase [Novosphingobium sp. M1R2S20]|uniref:Threonylcarbamoyl-AMP synthase n=1 Tax=Novosphingobium rhizovicinum TaxID=3228928 RepID=A0ABV3RAG5_9SPHN